MARASPERPSSSSGSQALPIRTQRSLQAKITNGTCTMSDFGITMMGGVEVRDMKVAPAPGRKESSSDSGGDSDVASVSSVGSRPGSRQLGDSSSRNSRQHHHSLPDCSVDIDGLEGRKLSTSLCTEFGHVFKEGGHESGLLKSLEMYGFQRPNKLQQHLIPVVLGFLGKQQSTDSSHAASSASPPPASAAKHKCCITIQGAPKTGRTSSVILAVLAAIDPLVKRPQAIVVSRSPKEDLHKYLRVFAVMETITYQAFSEQDQPPEIDEKSPLVLASQTAHVLVGHPKCIARVLSAVSSISLDAVKVLVVDDAHELFHGSFATQSTQPASPSRLRLSGLPSGSKVKAVSAGETDGELITTGNQRNTDDGDTATRDQAAEAETLVDSPIEDLVRICRALDDHSYSRDVRMVVIADQVPQKMMKLLKKSLMAKTNLLSVDNCPMPTKALKLMKHYHAVAPDSEWVRIFAGLVQTLSFPRAIIYCDSENIGRHLEKMQSLGIAVSANLPGAPGDTRKKALHDFITDKTQFLLTYSEPAVCKVMLPKVYCVFHFGIMSQLPAVYGVRLLPLDEKVTKESASILLIDAQKASKLGKSPVAKLESRFGITFMDMPWEFLPTVQSGSVQRK